MRYFLDCEFNGFGGELISLALVPAHAPHPVLYLVITDVAAPLDRWVRRNVLTVLDDVPEGVTILRVDREAAARTLGAYLRADDSETVIVADWPDDIALLCKLLLTGPGEMVATHQRTQFELVRVNSYPTDVVGAVRHNAVWDAMALRARLAGYWS